MRKFLSSHWDSFFDKRLFDEPKKKGCSIEWRMKSKCYILVIGSLDLSDMDTICVGIKTDGTGRSIFPIFFTHVSYHESDVPIEEHLRRICRSRELSRGNMESSEYLHYQSCTIYDRTSSVAWSSDELSEIWNMKMVECSHRFLYFEDCIRLFDFRKIKF